MNATSSNPNLQVVAAKDPVTGMAKVVVANQGNTDLNVSLSGFANNSMLSVYQTSATEDMQSLPPTNVTAGSGFYTFPANSVTTLLENTAPVIGNVSVAGRKLVLSGSGPIGGSYSYYVMSSTNLTAPISRWTPLATNWFNSDGTFNYTNGQLANFQRFFRLQMP